MEQLRRAVPVPLRPRLLVAPKLAHRLGPPHVQQRRRLGLHHHQRDAVDEQHEVGDDHPFVVFHAAPLTLSLPVLSPVEGSKGPADAELRGRHELVQAALRVVEVEESDGAGLPSPRPVHGEGHPVGQVLVDGLVAGHARRVDVLQVEDDALGLLLRHPLVQPHERGLQAALQQHLALASPLRRQRLARRVSPAEPLQQQTGRLLGVVVFVELGGGGHGSSCPAESNRRRSLGNVSGIASCTIDQITLSLMCK